MTTAPKKLPFTKVETTDDPDGSLRELVSYWDQKRAGRIGPKRAEIDPAEIKAHLPYLYMVDVLDGGANFRFRLVGTRVVQALGHDSTGKSLSEVCAGDAQALARMSGVLKRVMDQKVPCFSCGNIYWMPEARYRRFAGCSLPLSDDGVTVNIVLGELLFEHAGKLDTPHLYRGR